MDSLDDIQRHAVLQLRELVNGADEDVAVSVLSSVEWDVQVYLSTNPIGRVSDGALVKRAAELIFGTSLSANTPKPMRTPDVQAFEIDDSHQGELARPPRFPVRHSVRPVLLNLLVSSHRPHLLIHCSVPFGLSWHFHFTSSPASSDLSLESFGSLYLSSVSQISTSIDPCAPERRQEEVPIDG
jgi:hypothetical protein